LYLSEIIFASNIVNGLISQEHIHLLNEIKNAVFENEEVVICEILLSFGEEYGYEMEYIHKNELKLSVLKTNHKLNVDKYIKNIDLLLQTNMTLADKIFILYKIVESHFLSLETVSEMRIISKDVFFYKLVEYYDKQDCEVVLDFTDETTIFKFRERNKSFYTYLEVEEMLNVIKIILFSEEPHLRVESIDSDDNSILILVKFGS